MWTLQLEPSHYSAGSDRLSAYLLAWGKPKDLCLFTCFAALRASCSPGPRHVKEALLRASVLVQYSLPLDLLFRYELTTAHPSSSGDLAPLVKPFTVEESGQHSPRPYGLLSFATV